jgi:hypothetical protein
MFRKIALSTVTAALVLGSVSAGMAKDYDDIMKDSGRYVDMNGVPFPYSEYSQSGQARDARAQAAGHVKSSAPGHSQNLPYADRPYGDPDSW